MCNLHTFFDACPTPIACDDILNHCLRYFKESNSRSTLQLHLIQILYIRTTITTSMYKCTWLSIYPQADITLKNGYVYGLCLKVTTKKNENYKYCHNSVNIRDIRDISAYLSTTDITVYQGIYGI